MDGQRVVLSQYRAMMRRALRGACDNAVNGLDSAARIELRMHQSVMKPYCALAGHAGRVEYARIHIIALAKRAATCS